MFKKTLLAGMISLMLVVPALATYTQGNSDCSKGLDYLDALKKQNFVNVWTVQDKYDMKVTHQFLYKKATHEVAMISVSEKGICLNYAGEATKVNPDIKELKQFLDDAIAPTS